MITQNFYISKDKMIASKTYLQILDEIKTILNDKRFDPSTRIQKKNLNEAILVIISFIDHTQGTLFWELLKDKGIGHGNFLMNLN